VPRTSLVRERHLSHGNFLDGQLAIVLRELCKGVGYLCFKGTLGTAQFVMLGERDHLALATRDQCGSYRAASSRIPGSLLSTN
jgi:hypothetical protein